MTAELMPPPEELLLALAATGRPRPAIDFALGLAETGQTVDCLIVDVLAATQARVGALWEQNLWGVAEEHAATAVVDGVLGALALRTAPPATPRGTILVACVEHEYHTLPARMGAERLRADGWNVAFLGASLPAEDVQRFAAVAEPDAVVLSCTVPMFLPGAARGFAALADLGLATVGAGAGFGANADRATRLGASGWIGPGVDPTSVLSGALAPCRPPPEAHPEVAALEVRADELETVCLAQLSVRIPQMAGYSPRQLAHTRSDLRYILRYLAVAIDMDETPLFDQFIAWLAGILRSRSVPDSVLHTSLDVISAALEGAGLQRAAAMCASARRQVLPLRLPAGRGAAAPRAPDPQ